MAARRFSHRTECTILPALSAASKYEQYPFCFAFYMTNDGHNCISFSVLLHRQGARTATEVPWRLYGSCADAKS